MQRAIKSKDIIVADQIVLTVLLKSEKVLGDVVYARIRQGVEAGARAALGVVEKRGRWLGNDSINESPESDSVDSQSREVVTTAVNRSSENSGDSSWTGAAKSSVSEGDSSTESVSCQRSSSLLDLPLQGESQSAISSLSAPTSLASFSFTFDATNPRALSWASLRSSALITEISEDTRRAARDLVRHGIEEGIAPRKLAQQVRESIGLRTDQVEAVDNLIKEIRSARPGQVITRFPAREGVRTQTGFKVKVPKKVTEKWISQQRARYSRMQLNHRARMIARSESLHSANQGQKELWLQARDANQLPKDQKRVLIVTPDERLRKAHSSAAGQVVGIDEPFDMGDGTTEPGQAVACRCGQSLV